ncbi:MAG: PIN domain-containing protein [Solirubrobacteraceae bacterium]|jgi:predicted nucleic acid-binding protein
MRPVVLDTSVVLPAVLSPRGYRRRFWVLLALGALAARRDLARLEADALRVQAVAEGGRLGGLALEKLVDQAEAGYARLSEALPAGRPDDWRMVASRPLLAEYERKLREVGPRLDPNLRDTDIQAVRRQIEAVCADMTEDFDPELIPAYTTDRNDDPVIHTAVLAGATWLIADDKKHISTDPAGITEYTLPGSDRTVCALTFSRFLEHLTDVDLDDVDPGLIEVAFRPLGSK